MSRVRVFSLAWGTPLVAAVLGLGAVLADVDPALFTWVNAAGAHAPVLWSSVTATGDALFVLALFLPFVGRRPDIVWAAILAALIATVASHLLKDLLDLPRPAAVLAADQLNIIGPTLRKHAFPSGHATAAFTFAAVVALRVARPWVTASVLSAAVIVALSRVVVGAHWPVDVLGGAVVGWLSGFVAVALARRWSWGLLGGAQIAFGLFFLGCAVALADYDTGYPLASPLQRLAASACIAIAGWNVWRASRERRGQTTAG